jgi:hypothetical protein
MNTTEDDANRVSQILALLADRTKGAIGVLACLGVVDRAIPQMALDKEEKWVLQSAAWYAFQAFQMNIIRALDPASADRHSLFSLFDLLEKPGVRSAVSEAGKEAHIARAFDLWGQLKTDPKIKELRHLRNSALAHNLGGRMPAIWPDLSLTSCFRPGV